jgi:hypothetical protein
MTDKWQNVEDEIIRHVWIDTEGNQQVVPPNYYAANGTPYDGEGECDMEYHNTEINFSALDHKLAVIAAMFRESNMFHTPKSKEEATAWLENQSRGNPQAGIYFMVALNYAAEMVKQVLEGTHPGLTPTHDPKAAVPIPAYDATPEVK